MAVCRTLLQLHFSSVVVNARSSLGNCKLTKRRKQSCKASGVGLYSAQAITKKVGSMD